jgi:hypothetical protein
MQLVACLALGATISVWLGQDASFDLKHYHLYNAFALIDGRRGIDFVPAAFHGYFNPWPDVPYYLLATRWLADYPRVFAAVMGLPYGALAYLTWRLNRVVLPLAPALIATLISVTAVGTMSEIGTVFNDVPVAALIIGAMLLMMRSKYLLLAGALFGIAASIKLYALYYAVAAGVAFLIAHRRLRPLLASAAGGTAALAIFYGPWAWLVWQETGNPLFPAFNAVFRSPLFSPVNLSPNLKPLDWLDLLAPIKWARTNTMLISELTFRDGRLFAAYLAGFGLAAVTIYNRRWTGTREQLFVLVFAAAAYLIWLFSFRVLRYAIPLEALTGAIAMLFLTQVAPSRKWVGVGAGALLAAFLILTTIPISWGRVPYGDRVYPRTQSLPENSMVVVVGFPLAYILPLLDAPGLKAVGLTWLNGVPAVAAEFKHRIAAHQGPIFALTNSGSPTYAGANPGVAVSWRECEPVIGAPDAAICRASATTD